MAEEILHIGAELERQASLTPDRISHRFLRFGSQPDQELSFGELLARARIEAEILRGQSQPGDRVLLLYPPGLDFVVAYFACTLADLTPVPVARKATAPAFALDCRARYLLSPSGLQELTPRRPSQPHEPLALLQYTSGSTGNPRGVRLSQRALVTMGRRFAEEAGYDESSVTVSWLPHYHDLGFFLAVPLPVCSGTPTVLMAPAGFTQKPIRWLEAISAYRGTHSAAPNFGYQLCLDRITEDQKSSLDLSSWRVAFNAAEPIRAGTLEGFTQAFSGVGFRQTSHHPGYGLAEATLAVSGLKPAPTLVLPLVKEALEAHRVELAQADEAAVHLVGCGLLFYQTQVLIVNPDSGRACPPDRVGEIWVRGPCVGDSYWERPDDPTFHGHTADGEGPFLRTGDLGFLYQDQLFVTGRIKDMLIVEGRNIYPQDLEQSVESHPAVGNCAALCWRGDQGEAAVVVAELERSWVKSDRKDKLLEEIRQALAPHQCPVERVVLVKPPALPRTTSGKLRRSECLRRLEAGELKILASWSRARLASVPTSPVEARVAAQWSRALGFAVDDLEQDFFAAGGTSLQAALLVQYLYQEFGVEWQPAQLLAYPTIADQCRALRDSVEAYPHLVTLKSGRGTPFYCVPGMGQTALVLAPLLQQLKLPLAAFQPRGFLPGASPFSSVEEAATAYLKDLRTHQPEGPYRLGGICFGAWVALEMAQRLRAEGQEVSFTAIHNDPFNPSTKRPGPLRRAAAEFRFRLQRRRWLGSKPPLVARTWSAQWKAAERYRFQPFQGRTDLILSHLQQLEGSRAFPIRWSEIAQGERRVYLLPQPRPRNLLSPEALPQLASALNQSHCDPPGGNTVRVITGQETRPTVSARRSLPGRLLGLVETLDYQPGLQSGWLHRAANSSFMFDRSPLIRRLLRWAGWASWPARLLLHGLRWQHRWGRAVTSGAGLGPWTQAWQWWRLGWSQGISPEEYYRLSLFHKERRVQADSYLLQWETELFRHLSRPPRPDPVTDKLEFERRCRENQIPCVPAIPCASPLPPVGLAAKPTRGSQGQGLLLWDPVESSTWRDPQGRLWMERDILSYLRYLGAGKSYLLQRQLRPAPEVEELSNGRVPTVRVVSGRFPDGRVVLLAAVVKMPRGRQIQSSYGLCATVELDQGRLGRGFPYLPAHPGYERHPDGGGPIQGRHLPYWPEVKRLVLEAHRHFPEWPALGWDVALSRQGPLLLETNLNWETAAMQRTTPLGGTLLSQLLAAHQLESRRSRDLIEATAHYER